MSFHKEDGVSSLCQKALHIVTELCFAGQVEWEKCSSIFPPDGGNQGGSNTGNWGGLRSRPRSPRGLALWVLSSWVLRLPRGAGTSKGRLAFLSYPSPLVSAWRLPVNCSGFVFLPPFVRVLPLLWSASYPLPPFLAPRLLYPLSLSSRTPPISLRERRGERGPRRPHH